MRKIKPTLGFGGRKGFLGDRPASRCFQIAVGAFLLLSVADFLFTWKLISLDDSEVAEINPVACWILGQLGWPGMAAYKATLVAMIVATITAIRVRRTRVGDSVMTFGCGAQAAIVVSSILLLQGKIAQIPTDDVPDLHAERPMPEENTNLPPEGWRLLNQAAVQKELGLSTEYLFLMGQHAELVRTFHQRFRNENASEVQSCLTDIASNERSLASWLTPAQRARLQQISWQVRGPLALTDDDVINALSLTNDQLIRLYEIVAAESPDGRRPDPEQTKALLWSVLDANQQAAWRTMLGPPCPLDTPAPMPEPPAVLNAGE